MFSYNNADVNMLQSDTQSEFYAIITIYAEEQINIINLDKKLTQMNVYLCLKFIF